MSLSQFLSESLPESRVNFQKVLLLYEKSVAGFIGSYDDFLYRGTPLSHDRKQKRVIVSTL